MRKEEIMKDLKFCQELMNRLVKFAEEKYDCNCSGWQYNHTTIKNDIIRLRRELNEVRNKTDTEIIKLDTVLNIIEKHLGGN